MLRGNLATRPFYNERAVHMWVLLAAIVIAAATVFNVTRVLKYSRSDTRLATQASTDEARAADLRRQATRLRAAVDQKQLAVKASQAQLANDLIDRRTFSWTELFNRFETTLPDEVRIGAVRPTVDKDRHISLRIHVFARGVDDVNAFMENLEKTGAFARILSRDERTTDKGEFEADLETNYLPARVLTAGDRSEQR
jgi:type IV pilus assembly protein PilN